MFYEAMIVNVPPSHGPVQYNLVHTNILPSYNFVQAENAYLKQAIEWRDAVLQEQQMKIDALHKANSDLQHDAMRWNKFKHIIDAQKGQLSGKQLQNIVDSGDRNG